MKRTDDIKENKCLKCGEVKPVSEFYLDRRGFYYNECKDCRRLRNLEYSRKRKGDASVEEKPRRKYVRRKQETNDDCCRDCKSYSSCGVGNGFCLARKVFTWGGDCCDKFRPNVEVSYAQETRLINVHGGGV